MKFTISARQTNSANTADGYLEWQEVDEWNAENAETAIDQWMDNMRYVDDRWTTCVMLTTGSCKLVLVAIGWTIWNLMPKPK